MAAAGPRWNRSAHHARRAAGRAALALAARRLLRLVALLAGAASATGFKPLGLWPVTLLCFALFIHLLWQAADRRGAFPDRLSLRLRALHHRSQLDRARVHIPGLDAALARLFLAVPLLSICLAVYPAAGALAGWWIGKKAAHGDVRLFVTILAATWLVSEYLRATLFTGFAWIRWA